GVEYDPEEEDIEVFDTFQANAMAKARYFVDMIGKPVLADDSGLCVDALDGAPGVRTKRFSGRDDLAGQDLDDANNRALLAALEGVPDEERAAHYVCVAVLLTPSGVSASAVGTFSGRIGHAPRGSGGFGYDPIFELPERGVTVAELHAEE
ncbi:MAG: non-canonical purine NTP pyrophosphatase, partial [Gammaproteobacteria bacterium]|nr:non-canonical purine NTP pyrophosphatase [Gemmatimonadota bacterium]NIU79830.1 non-canonical purine NTP pyrophosphatase [Gammaproteobacteria bacterium]